MSAEDIIRKLRNFFEDYVGNKKIDLDEKIFSTGLVNSLFAMQLVLFLEKEFQLKIANEDLDLKNFSSLNTISEFVLKKQAP